MKKSVFLLFIILLAAAYYVFAGTENIYDYLRKMDANYGVVLGVNGKSGDSFAAADIIIGLKKNFNLDIEPAIESNVTQNVNKLLVGHPCDNSLIKLSCEYWPYDKGIGLIKIMDNDLVIAGTTVDDTRRAAKVIANYKNFQELKEYKEVLVFGATLNMDDIRLQPVKKQQEFVCGDNICDIGEKFDCLADCLQTSCFKICQEKNFVDASCKDLPSNPALPPCGKNEINQGFGYCAGEKICCCKEKQQSHNQQDQNDQQLTSENKVQEKQTVWEIMWQWLKEFFSVIF